MNACTHSKLMVYLLVYHKNYLNEKHTAFSSLLLRFVITLRFLTNYRMRPDTKCYWTLFPSNFLFCIDQFEFFSSLLLCFCTVLEFCLFVRLSISLILTTSLLMEAIRTMYIFFNYKLINQTDSCLFSAVLKNSYLQDYCGLDNAKSAFLSSVQQTEDQTTNNFRERQKRNLKKDSEDVFVITSK